jgi:glycosyltransferase involved in cell wall biosynthesis
MIECRDWNQKSDNHYSDQDFEALLQVLNSKAVKVGVEIGVGSGNSAESILKKTVISRLYGIDPYMQNFEAGAPEKRTQKNLDELFRSVLERMEPFGNRYLPVRKDPNEVTDEVKGQIDFLHLNSVYSYHGIWDNLCKWSTKIRDKGVIVGHNYGHPNFPAVKEAVNTFLNRFGWTVNIAGEYAWWIDMKLINISFFIPVYNCSATIEESVDSIMDGNFKADDELVICNDSSTDNTGEVLLRLKKKYPVIQVDNHRINKGGGAARNTAIELTSHPLLFCLDSDNILVPGSVLRLKEFLLTSGADVAAFKEVHFFKNNPSNVTLKLIFEPTTTLADYLSGPVVPGANGNYMFTRESWLRAGGYPEFSGALDAWGFGFRQVATGSRMMTLADSFYLHRYGYESYWVREKKKGNNSLIALQLIIPFIDLIEEEDVKYMIGKEGRQNWFSNLQNRPIRVKYGKQGKIGKKIPLTKPASRFSLNKLKVRLQEIFSIRKQ